MKNSISILTVLAIFLTASWNLQAQRPHPGPPHSGPGLEQFAEALGITEDQKTELKALHETQREEAKALMEEDFETPEARREAMKELRESHQQALDDILTDDQRKKLEELKAEAKAKREMNRQERIDNFKAMREEMNTYREKEMLPVLREQRTKLEAMLSEEDRTDIAQLRAKRPERRADHADFEPGQRPRRPELTEEQRAAMKADREQIKGLMEKYDGEITALLEEIESQQATWKEAMQEIAEKYAPGDLRDRPERGKRDAGEMRGKRRGHDQQTETARRPGKGQSPHRGGKGRMDHKTMGKVQFLLMDPNAEVAAREVPKNEFAEIRIFPNPSASRNTVNYQLKDAGHYRVELRDKDGLVLTVLSNQYREPGNYREEVDVLEYASGTYYLSIVGAEGVVSKKLVIAK